jgi:hypothetical protein
LDGIYPKQIQRPSDAGGAILGRDQGDDAVK